MEGSGRDNGKNHRTPGITVYEKARRGNLLGKQEYFSIFFFLPFLNADDTIPGTDKPERKKSNIDDRAKLAIPLAKRSPLQASSLRLSVPVLSCSSFVPNAGRSTGSLPRYDGNLRD